MTQEPNMSDTLSSVSLWIVLYFPVWIVIGIVAAGLWFPYFNPYGKEIQLAMILPAMVLIAGGALWFMLGVAVLLDHD